jgi:hypothetical protein
MSWRAEQRKDGFYMVNNRPGAGCGCMILAVCLGYVLVGLALWGGAIYAVIHFARKYW